MRNSGCDTASDERGPVGGNLVRVGLIAGVDRHHLLSRLRVDPDGTQAVRAGAAGTQHRDEQPPAIRIEEIFAEHRHRTLRRPFDAIELIAPIGSKILVLRILDN